jgi:GAF domain-containing protein
MALEVAASLTLHLCAQRRAWLDEDLRLEAVAGARTVPVLEDDLILDLQCNSHVDILRAARVAGFGQWYRVAVAVGIAAEARLVQRRPVARPGASTCIVSQVDLDLRPNLIPDSYSESDSDSGLDVENLPEPDRQSRRSVCGAPLVLSNGTAFYARVF